jgi:hypothetical protein
MGVESVPEKKLRDMRGRLNEKRRNRCLKYYLDEVKSHDRDCEGMIKCQNVVEVKKGREDVLTCCSSKKKRK